MAESRARTGYSSRLDLAQAQAEYEGTAQTVPQLELAIAQQENALSSLIGETPGAIERGVTLSELRIPPIPAGLPADVLAEAFRHATNRYRAGYSPHLDQLDAQRGLLSAELSLVQIQADGLTASVNLYRAMGGGWQAPNR